MEEEDRMKQDAGGCAAQGPRALGCAAVAGTVAGSRLDPERNVIGQRQWEDIHDRRAAGQSVSAIARNLELDRKTVQSCLRRLTWQPYRREVTASKKLDEHMDWLAQRAPQVHYSARILHQELRAQRGFTGCYETVKLAVRPLRTEATVSAITQRRFETGPGEQAQVDWGEMTVRFGTERVKVRVFVMTLGYSRRGYTEGFLRERMPDLLAAHENAFAHFGGRCETLLYDRMRTVVIGQTVDEAGRSRPKLNTTFDAFARHWGFTPRLCQPNRAQTKGKVESGVKYVKRNFGPGRQFHDLEGFNAQLACVAGGGRGPAHPRHHARAADRPLRGRGVRAGAGGWSGQLLAGDGARARGR